MVEDRCAWCHSLETLEQVHGTEGGDAYYLCPECPRTTRVDRWGLVHQVEPTSTDERATDGSS